jgi:small subunit ribosomal protein S17
MTESGAPKRVLVGKVVSSRMDKTIVVQVDRVVPHPLYGKYIRRSTKVHAHDEARECREGDLVQIASTRPLSKRKSWIVDRIITKAN